MSGSRNTKQSIEVDESQLASWLKDHPDFFVRHPECLSAIDLPVKTGPAISLHQYQVRVLREEKSRLTQKLGVLVKNVKTNHKIHSDLLGLAGSMIQLARSGAKPQAHYALIKKHFALHDVKLLRKSEFPEQFKALKEILGKRDSICDNEPDQELLKAVFDKNAENVLSIAIVPVKQGIKFRALLLLAADDEERFKPGMGGEFLKLLARLVSSLLDDEQG